MRLCLLSIIFIATFVRPANAIVGGEPAPHGSWSTVVYISQGCTGTLIHPKLVVFAAHCGSDIDFVSFGQNIESPERRVKTVKCDTFSESRLRNGTDFAYCLLVEPQNLSVVLPLLDHELHFLKPGKSATLVGFGLNDDGKMGIKHVAESAIGCLTPHGEMFIGGGGVDSCAGDSGGPAFIFVGEGRNVQQRLVGIASYGSVCGSGGYYARIDRAIDWLETETGFDLSSSSSTPSVSNNDVEQWNRRITSQGNLIGLRARPNKPVGIDNVPPRIRIVDTILKNGHDIEQAELQIEVKTYDPKKGCGLATISVEVDGQIKAPIPPDRDKIKLKLKPGSHSIKIFALDRAHNRSMPVSHSVVVGIRKNNQ